MLTRGIFASYLRQETASHLTSIAAASAARATLTTAARWAQLRRVVSVRAVSMNRRGLTPRIDLVVTNSTKCWHYVAAGLAGLHPHFPLLVAEVIKAVIAFVFLALVAECRGQSDG